MVIASRVSSSDVYSDNNVSVFSKIPNPASSDEALSRRPTSPKAMGLPGVLPVCLSTSVPAFLGTGDIFNRTTERICGCHMLFNQRLISAIKPGIRPGKREIESMHKSNSINHNKCVDTYADWARVTGQLLIMW